MEKYKKFTFFRLGDYRVIITSTATNQRGEFSIITYVIILMFNMNSVSYPVMLTYVLLHLIIRSEALQICEDLRGDVTEMLHEQPESIMVKDILASVYFWRFLLQYSLAVYQTKEKIMESSSDLSSEEEELGSPDGTPPFEQVILRYITKTTDRSSRPKKCRVFVSKHSGMRLHC